MEQRKGLSPLIAAVILIAAAITIAGILAFWSSGFMTEKLGEAERLGITGGTKCLRAQFELRSISLEGTTLYLILNNKKSVDLELTNLILIKSDNTVETKPLNETLKGNDIKAITVEDVSSDFLKGEIRTHCPDVSVSFTLDKGEGQPATTTTPATTTAPGAGITTIPPTTTAPATTTQPVTTFSLSLSPNTAYPYTTITATVSGLSGYAGNVYVGVGKYIVLMCWCEDVELDEDSCECYFDAQTYKGVYTYYAKIDKNGDGDYSDPGEVTEGADLTVECGASGDSCGGSNPPCCGSYYCSGGVCKYAGGGCPHAYTWNGNEYVLDNNLMPFSEAKQGDVEDYYKLEKPLAQENGKHSLMIGEFEQEHSYFDQVQLLAIDHDSDVNVAPSPFGEILTYKNPVPAFAFDNELNDLTLVLNAIDGNAFEGDKDDFIILNFGRVDNDNAKLVMRADLRLGLQKRSIHVQVLRDGEWEEVAVVIPRNYWADDAVDLSDYLTEDELVVRLYFTSTHKIDFVGLDTSEQAGFDMKYGNLVSAVHSEDGNVKQKLMKSDETYAELIPGQNIKLDFTLPNGNKEVRDFIFYSKGHYYKIE